MRPLLHLAEYSRKYPDAWRFVDQMRASRGQALPAWPEWCFLPLAGPYAIVTHTKGGLPYSTQEIIDIAALGALAAWRVTKGIYRFDPDVYNDLIRTPLTGDIPHEVLFALPEWCVYVETPGMSLNPADGTYTQVYGFFAHLEYDVNDKAVELRLLCDTDDKSTPLVPQPIPLGPWSLNESLDRMIEKSKKNALNFQTELNDYIAAFSFERFKADLRQVVEPLVSLMLYLCAANGEIVTRDSDRRAGEAAAGQDKKRPPAVRRPGADFVGGGRENGSCDTGSQNPGKD